MTLEVNLCELTAPFESCILETERMETGGNCLRLPYIKCITWVTKLLGRSLFLFLRREIFFYGDILKLQRVMLIKWENFGAFFIMTY
jgi:hypothetical protein